MFETRIHKCELQVVTNESVFHPTKIQIKTLFIRMTVIYFRQSEQDIKLWELFQKKIIPALVITLSCDNKTVVGVNVLKEGPDCRNLSYCALRELNCNKESINSYFQSVSSSQMTFWCVRIKCATCVCVCVCFKGASLRLFPFTAVLLSFGKVSDVWRCRKQNQSKGSGGGGNRQAPLSSSSSPSSPQDCHSVEAPTVTALIRPSGSEVETGRGRGVRLH